MKNEGDLTKKMDIDRLYPVDKCWCKHQHPQQQQPHKHDSCCRMRIDCAHFDEEDEYGSCDSEEDDNDDDPFFHESNFVNPRQPYQHRQPYLHPHSKQNQRTHSSSLSCKNSQLLTSSHQAHQQQHPRQPVTISRRQILNRINDLNFDCSTMLRPEPERLPSFYELSSAHLDSIKLVNKKDLNGNHQHLNLNIGTLSEIEKNRIMRNYLQNEQNCRSQQQQSAATLHSKSVQNRQLFQLKNGSVGASISSNSSASDLVTPEKDAPKQASNSELADWSEQVILQENIQSEIYNSEHSQSIMQLREITNQINNQIVLTSDTSEADEDIWFCKKMLYSDHIREVCEKLPSLDDEIRCKIIYLERNRRVSKAYIRLPYLIVTGANSGFDGYTIGLSGFSNANRDTETAYILANLEKGLRIKIDESGNLIMRRTCNFSVQVKDWLQQLTDGVGSLSDEVIALHGRLPFDKAITVFEMQRFNEQLLEERAKPEPDLTKLKMQCLLSISFGKQCFNLINSPCWMLVINCFALRKCMQSEIVEPERPLVVEIPEPDYGDIDCLSKPSKADDSVEDARSSPETAESETAAEQCDEAEKSAEIESQVEQDLTESKVALATADQQQQSSQDQQVANTVLNEEYGSYQESSNENAHIYSSI